MPDVPISTLLGDLRRVAEQMTRLLGDLRWLMKELEQGSVLPALTAVLHDLGSAVEDLARLLGDARRLVDGLEEGDLLERARTIVGAQHGDENQQAKEEARIMGDLSGLIKKLQYEVANRRSV
jgi:hypothetical protein